MHLRWHRNDIYAEAGRKSWTNWMSASRWGFGVGDAMAQAAAPAEGGGDTEQGQGAGHGGAAAAGGWANHHIDGVNGVCSGCVLEVGGDEPGADQTRCGEAQGGEGGVVEGGAAVDGGAVAVRSFDAKETIFSICIVRSKNGTYPTGTGGTN